MGAALPQSLARAGCEVKVFMPLYKNIKPEKMHEGFGVTRQGDVEVFFIKHDHYYQRDSIYVTEGRDYPDNLERFSFFSRQVLEVLKKINFSPDIINNNDWQASMVSVYLKALYGNDSFFKRTRLVLTIHNLAYQGIFERDKFFCLGLPRKYFDMKYLEFYGRVNTLKGGIVFSDLITTVSHAYARQIQTPEYGCGLDGILRERKESLLGILNAVDYNIWNPATDRFIYQQYSPQTLEAKEVNKAGLQKELGLKADKDKLLMGMVSRLAEQKGIDILEKTLDKILKKHQVVILGVGEPLYHTLLKQKEAKFKHSLSVQLKFDEALAHKIYAAADVFLLPSRFEPCGLSQMISYKYATVPLVHHTGGLIDTVRDVTEGGGGFVFKKYTAAALAAGVKRADEFFQSKEKWRPVLAKITGYNFSWEVAAAEYIKAYKKILN